MAEAQDLAQLQALIRKPDAILESTIFQIIPAFFDAGGDVVDLVSSMTTNYFGVAEVCNLSTQILSQIGLSDDDLAEIHETLTEVLQEGFDPDWVDKTYMHGNQRLPDLTNMIANPAWRRLIYKLAERYPKCLFINYIIQLFVDNGLQNEIARVSTASNYLNVFSDILTTKLLHIDSLLSTDTNAQPLDLLDRINERVSELAQSCCQSEQTYTYSLILLQNLMADSLSSSNMHRYVILKRTEQEIMSFLLKNTSSPADATKLHSLVSMSRTNGPREVIDAVMNVIAAGSTTPADVLMLQNIYSQTGRFQNQPIPELEYLRDPLFIDILIKDLFIHRNKVSTTHKDRYIWLLSYCVSAVESPPSASMSELKPTLLAIKKFDSCIDRLDFNGPPNPTSLAKLFMAVGEELRIPIVASIFLKWLQSSVKTHPEKIISLIFDENVVVNSRGQNSQRWPVLYVLLDEIAYSHPVLQSLVFDSILAIFMNLSTNGITTNSGIGSNDFYSQRLALLDRLVHLVTLGFIGPCFRFIVERVKAGETELAIVFLQRTLSFISPTAVPPSMSNLIVNLLEVIQKSNADVWAKEMESEKFSVVTEFLEKANISHG